MDLIHSVVIPCSPRHRRRDARQEPAPTWGPAVCRLFWRAGASS